MSALPKLITALPLTLLITTFANIASADPPPCQRWQNRLDDCELLGRPKDASGSCGIIFGLEIEKINHRRFAPNAQTACEKTGQLMFPGKPLKMWPVDATPENENADDPNYEQARCVWDVTGKDSVPDGEFTWADWEESGGTFVDLNKNVMPDAHCFCTVQGPYSDIDYSSRYIPTSTFAKWTFPYALKKKVLEANLAKNGNVYKTDAVLKSNGSLFDWFTKLQKDDHTLDDAAEIDHIIPRVDSKGCLCGSATKENAAVISRKLNGLMSNTSPKYNYSRSLMYKNWVTCRDPSVAETLPFYNPNAYQPANDTLFTPAEFAETDESLADIDADLQIDSCRSGDLRPVEEDISAGGCAASGGALLGAAVALLGLVRRRRVS